MHSKQHLTLELLGDNVIPINPWNAYFPVQMTISEQQSTIPPYVPYRTFQTFLEFLADEGIPDRIDRTVWGPRFSGSSGTQLMTALKVLALIDPEGSPTQDLDDLVHAEGEARRSTLRHVLERFYTPVFALDLTRASRGQFHEAFRSFGTKEGVLTKCEAFFIRAAQSAGIELSRHITAGRHGSGRTRSGTASTRHRPASPPAPLTEKSTTKPAPEAPAQSTPNQLELADRILAKYPDFDPSWDPDVQAKWLEGMTRLYEGLNTSNADKDESLEN